MVQDMAVVQGVLPLYIQDVKQDLTRQGPGGGLRRVLINVEN